MNLLGFHIELETILPNKIYKFGVEISIDKLHLNRFFPCDISLVAKSVSSVNMVLCQTCLSILKCNTNVSRKVIWFQCEM